MPKRTIFLIVFAVVCIGMIGAIWYYGEHTSNNSMTYHNAGLGFSFDVPSGAVVSESSGAPAGPHGVTVQVALGTDKQNFVLINSYKASSTDTWLKNNVSFAIDAQGNKIPSYENKIINGNSAAVLMYNQCIQQAVIYNSGIVYVISPHLVDSGAYLPSGQAYCSAVDQIVSSFHMLE